MKGKNQKRLIERALLFSLLFFSSFLSFSEATYLPISAKSAVIISLKDGQPIYDRSSDLRLPMASTTKVMTALLAAEYLQGDEPVLISENVTAVQPVKLGLKEGARYRADDLLYGLLLYSANDAGVALAEKVAGSEERFVGMMNQKARALGALNTHFNNATGLPGEGQYTTASDLALILQTALQNEKVMRIMQTKYAYIHHNGRRLFIKNKNRLLWECPWAVGGKTGFTRMAGHCYAGEFKNEDNGFVVVLLGSKRLWADTRALVDYGKNLLFSPGDENTIPSPTMRKDVKRTTKRTVHKMHKTKKKAKQQFASKSKKKTTTKYVASRSKKKKAKQQIASKGKKTTKMVRQAKKESRAPKT
jgi:D-alanyl-D-alanine carboxypeptidase (penicillin-binding protein 5/6)